MNWQPYYTIWKFIVCKSSVINIIPYIEYGCHRYSPGRWPLFVLLAQSCPAGYICSILSFRRWRQGFCLFQLSVTIARWYFAFLQKGFHSLVNLFKDSSLRTAHYVLIRHFIHEENDFILILELLIWTVSFRDDKSHIRRRFRLSKTLMLSDCTLKHCHDKIEYVNSVLFQTAKNTT